MKTPALLMVIILFCSCREENSPLFKKDLNNKIEKDNQLFVFVGEKEDVHMLPQEEGSMDEKFFGKYKVLERIYGDYSTDQIEFIAYDHYGFPEFGKHKTVMLFLTKHEGKYYHVKYRSYNVCKTTSGEWAGTYMPDKSSSLQMKKMDFAEEVYYPVDTATIPLTRLKELQNDPYLKFAGDRCYTNYGALLPDIFLYEKKNSLREYFEKFEHTLDLRDAELAPVTDYSAPSLTDTSAAFHQFWKVFESALKNDNAEIIKQNTVKDIWFPSSGNKWGQSVRFGRIY